MVHPAKNLLNSQASTQVSNLQRIWDRGGFAFSVQFPPLLTAAGLIEQLTTHSTLFDAVMTADAPGGAIGLSSLAIAILLKHAGIESIVHVSGRDRNRLALQSDMLSQGALGIPNLLIDMQPVARASFVQNTDARFVTDLDGPVLLATAVMLRDEAHFISGASIKTPPALHIGAYGDLATLAHYARAGALSSAQYLVTTPVSDAHTFCDELAEFQTAHPGFLQSRPLVVSLPFLTNSSPEYAYTGEAREAGIQQIVSTIANLKELAGIRGVNIVLSDQADLAVLERVVRNAASAERE